MASAEHYRRDIDGLRAVAVLAVLLFHAFPTALPGGFVGVDIFFVISGYLITGILLRELQAGNFSIRRFYARRVKRIFPALILVMAVTLLAGWFILIPQEYEKLGTHTINAAASIANFGFWKESGYFDTTSDLKPLLHLWSLGIEEQFYFIWPFILMLAWRYRHRELGVLIGLLAASLTMSVLLSSSHPVPSFFLLHTRFWELMAGGLLAYYQPRLTHHHYKVLPWLGAVLVAASMIAISKVDPYPGWRAILPVLGTALILGSSHSAIHRHLLSNRLMVGIGLISYPLYLWHWPQLSYARILYWQEPPAIVIAGLMVLAAVLAWLTYHFVERPVRGGTIKRPVRWLLALMALLAVAGFAVKSTDGFRARQHAVNPMIADLTSSHEFTRTFPVCPKAYGVGDSWCFFSKKNSSPAMAVLGDSHAGALFPGFATQDTQHTWMLIGNSGCPPLTGIKSHVNDQSDVCLIRTEKVVQALAAQADVKTVVIASLGSLYIGKSMSPQHKDKRWKLESVDSTEAGLSQPELFYRGLSRTVDTLEKAGKQVVLYADVPTLNFYASACLKRLGALSPKDAVKEPCSVPLKTVARDQEIYRLVLARIQTVYPQVRVFDSRPFLCDAEQCRAADPDMLLYSDSHHLSVRGSQMMAEPFVKWLDEEHQ